VPAPPELGVTSYILFFMVVAPLARAVAWCLRERSRRKTIKEVLPGLTQADPATIREISRLLASSRWQIGQRPSSRPALPGPPSDQTEAPNPGPNQAVS
jgi:hypothetical protein